MSLRPAEDKDCETTWRWRLADETRGHYAGLTTTFGTHESWFARNHSRIQMWDVNGTATGMVRIESDGTVHFSCDDNEDAAVEMVRAVLGAVRRHGGRLKALIDSSDVFRATVFRRAGFVEFDCIGMIYKGGV